MFISSKTRPIFGLSPGRTRLITLLVLACFSITYLCIALGFVSAPSPSSLDIDIPWHRFPASFGFGTKIRYVDGVAYVEGIGRTGKHPIEELIERGRKKAKDLEDKKAGVKTLRDAVDDYKREYGMDPPEGFNKWYELALSLNAPAVPSLYPLAHTSVLPFLSLPAPVLRQRATDLVWGKRGIFGIVYRPEAKPEEQTESVSIDSITIFKTLHLEWVDLSKNDTALLPHNENPEVPMMLPVWVDDVSHHPPSARILEESRRLARAGKVWDEDELLALELEEESKKGWGNACGPVLNMTMGQTALSAVEKANREQASFIDDPWVYADPCIHPEHLRQNGEMIMKEDWTVRGLLPLTSLNSPMGGGEIIGPTTIGRKVIVPYMPWSEKTESRLWWRGNANSAFVYDKWDWREGQRFRLSEMASGRKEKGTAEAGTKWMIPEEERVSPVLLDREEHLRREWFKRDVLRQTYFNMSLINAETGWPCGKHYAPFFYCDNPDGIRRPNCPPVRGDCRQILWDEYEFINKVQDKSYEYKHKFRLDVDGFGWTTRWREELSKNNVVIKVTLYPEWWSPQAIPWFHYVPGRYDFSDLYDIMAFFTGTPEERAGEISAQRQAVLSKRDKLAEEIAARGRELAVNSLRWEDMRVYMFLLLLEYRRAWSDDRVAATFKMD